MIDTKQYLADDILAVIRNLGDFCVCHDMESMSAARRGIVDLAVDNEAVADTLWNIAITVQRALMRPELQDEQ